MKNTLLIDEIIARITERFSANANLFDLPNSELDSGGIFTQFLRLVSGSDQTAYQNMTQNHNWHGTLGDWMKAEMDFAQSAKADDNHDAESILAARQSDASQPTVIHADVLARYQLAPDKAWQSAFDAAWDRYFEALSPADQEAVFSAPTGQVAADLAVKAYQAANEIGGDAK